jgi:hypothetical protein
VFERFTERARQVVVLAQDEARSLNHNYIGTEHLLLGLLREEEGLAARVLTSLGVDVEDVRADVARIIGVGDEIATGQIPFTPRAKKVLELSMREAVSLGHQYIGTEHILLGLARENEGVGARILLDFGVDAETLRNEIIQMLSGPRRRPGEPSGRPAPSPFAPESPPLAPEVGAEIEQVRREKEEALEQQDFERAAKLRDRERKLVDAARHLMRVWAHEESPPPPPFAGPGMRFQRAGDVRLDRSERVDVRMTYVVSVLVCAVAFPVGLLIGWLIWG